MKEKKNNKYTSIKFVGKKEKVGSGDWVSILDLKR